jgi:hypothetical protein
MENKCGIAGLRFQIAGSAGEKADPATLRDVHEFVRLLVGHILARGGGLSVTAGGESYLEDGTPRIFDWTVIEAIVDYYEHITCYWPGNERKSISINVYANFDGKIPETRRELWACFTSLEQVEFRRRLKIEENFGHTLRDEQSKDGDILITIGGAQGVFDLANLYKEKNKNIIPLFFDVGNKASQDLSGRASNDPESYFSCTNPASVNRLYMNLQFNAIDQSDQLAMQVMQIAEEIAKLQPSKAEIYRELIFEELNVAFVSLQQRQYMLRQVEDNYSGLLVEVLNAALKARGLRAEEQKPSGKSPTADIIKGDAGGVGELDFQIVNVATNELITICEAMVIRDCNLNTDKIKTHLNKIFGYDLAGLPWNFIINYVTNEEFLDSWNAYQEIIQKLEYDYPLLEIRPIEKIGNANIRMISSVHRREGVTAELIHIFLKLDSKKLLFGKDE